MPTPSARQLRTQFAYALAEGWLSAFHLGAAKWAIPEEVLLGIASRETAMRNIAGDFAGGHPHGFGVMQIDDRGVYGQWCRTGLWKDAREAIAKGSSVLSAKREAIRDSYGDTIHLAGRRTPLTFVGPHLTDNELLATSIAAYNVGMLAYYGQAKYDDPDRFTTGKDYSRDVLARSKVFAKLLGEVDADEPRH